MCIYMQCDMYIELLFCIDYMSCVVECVLCYSKLLYVCVVMMNCVVGLGVGVCLCICMYMCFGVLCSV